MTVSETDKDLYESPRLSRYILMRERRAYNFPGERTGQRYFNALCDVELELANEIRGTSDDPFYDDGRLPEFMGLVCARLTKPANATEHRSCTG